MTPFFLTGANALIKINNVTIAYCMELHYSVQVQHDQPKILGMYEGPFIEPIGYSVTGGFTVIRYVANAALHNTSQPNVSIKGNGAGAWGPSDPRTIDKMFNTGNDGMAHQALNPVRLNNSIMFDIDVYQKVKNEDIWVATLEKCRITQSDFSLAKRSAALGTFNFMAVYAKEDSTRTSPSGVGQDVGI